MASSLKTHDVLLDTTVFSEQNHNYRSKAMKALADLAAQDKVGVHITRVVLEEVRAHIRQGVAEAVNLHEHFQDKARILKNSPGVFAAQFKKLDRRALEKELLGQLNRFVKKTKAKIIPYACARPKDVFDDYFARKSPFGDGKQKSEFPDAFSLAAARAWAKKHKKILYVVSGDKAVREACDNNILLPLERLSDFLDLLAKEEARANAVYSAISTQFDADAAPQIEKAFERWGFGLEDRDGDVEDVEVASIHLEDIDILKLEHSRAEVELWANVEFTAVATYADLDNAAWDSEEKKFMFWETLTENIEDEKRLKVLATVVLDDPNNPTSIDFENIEIDARDTFWLQLAEDKTNYK